MQAAIAVGNPFPGIRSFERDESFLFYGRKEQAEELLRLLSDHRFVAVVGASGSGKSSLVKAGLVPLLYRGYLPGASSHWRIAVMRPGGRPISALAKALRDSGPEFQASGEGLAATLESSSQGLVETVRNSPLPSPTCLLVIVDQFEELFRFRRETESADGGREAARFVSLLLAAASQAELPIYIVLTMRSDFLGDCARFAGLPEALNRSQHLIPRPDRKQMEEAIVLPLDRTPAEITPVLVQTLLNDTGDDPDQLPALQHSLRQLYQAWKDNGCNGELDLPLYTATLRVGRSLDSHATALFESLSESGRKVTERLFRCLTATEDGRAVRRPKKLHRIYAVLGAESEQQREEIDGIIRLYGSRENSLVLISTAGEDEDPVIDITHESLIRQWRLLREWVKAEAESADWIWRLARSTELYRRGSAGYWGDPEASIAAKRAAEENWNAAWAAQYCEGFDEAMVFLRESREQIERERVEEEDRRRREIDTAHGLADAERKKAQAERRGRIITLWGVGALAVALAVVLWFAWRLKQEEGLANDLRRAAQASEDRAKAAENIANARAAEIEASRAKGDEQRRLAAMAEQYRKQASDLSAKAAKAETAQSASDAAIQRIYELQKELSAATSEIQRLKNTPVQSTPPDSSSTTVKELQGQLTRANSTIEDLRKQLAEKERKLEPSVAPGIQQKQDTRPAAALKPVRLRVSNYNGQTPGPKSSLIAKIPNHADVVSAIESGVADFDNAATGSNVRFVLRDESGAESECAGSAVSAAVRCTIPAGKYWQFIFPGSAGIAPITSRLNSDPGLRLPLRKYHELDTIGWDSLSPVKKANLLMIFVLMRKQSGWSPFVSSSRSQHTMWDSVHSIASVSEERVMVAFLGPPPATPPPGFEVGRMLTFKLPGWVQAPREWLTASTSWVEKNAQPGLQIDFMRSSTNGEEHWYGVVSMVGIPALATRIDASMKPLDRRIVSAHQALETGMGVYPGLWLEPKTK